MNIIYIHALKCFNALIIMAKYLSRTEEMTRAYNLINVFCLFSFILRNIDQTHSLFFCVVFKFENVRFYAKNHLNFIYLTMKFHNYHHANMHSNISL